MGIMDRSHGSPACNPQINGDKLIAIHNTYDSSNRPKLTLGGYEKRYPKICQSIDFNIMNWDETWDTLGLGS
jgi:hypothetical protein